MSMSERLIAAMEASGVSQASLARACGVKPPSVNGWLSGKAKFLRGENLLSAAAALGVNQQWLATGEGQMKPSHTAGNIELSELSFIGVAKGTVPLISSVRAGAWGEINAFDLDAEETFAVRDSNVGARAFALRVEGDSMTWDGRPNFTEGTILVVDPDRAAKAGDYVIAKNTDKQAALFKKLVTDGLSWQLKSLNRDYKPIEIDDPSVRVIGVVVEYWLGGKL
jgi:SOS-response transcriptional repressor LexA